MIERVGIVGAGTMGVGLAQLCAQSGFSVKVHDSASSARETLPRRLKAGLDAAVLKGKLETGQADRAFGSVAVASKLEDLGGADIVIEAAPEDLELKQALFGTLSRSLPEALLVTNTSSLSVAEIMKRASRPERSLGLHFFNPPVAMRLVEMVRTEKTSAEAFREAFDFVLTLKRVPVDVKDAPGFIVNRAMRPYYVHAQRLVGTAAPFSAIDEACRSLGGLPMGPFELMDLIGLDTNLAITRSIFEALGRPERLTPPELQSRLVDRGLLGRKSGRGFYLYVDGQKNGENPQAMALLKAGGSLSGADVWRRLREALIAEAELLVQEGAASASDVDVAIKLAMNFPKGPFEWRKENL